MKLRNHRKLLMEFDEALHSQQLLLHYQPKIDLHNGRVIGLEALVRWQHPSQGLMMPGLFLPLIEGTSHEIALGEWVLKSALKQYALWLNNGLRQKLSVNISPRHMQMEGFVDFLENVLSAYPDTVAENLELEILETTSFADIAEVAEIMAECSKLGVHFSLDDFGTGYSSLTYFHRLPIDVLKIDQNFVKEMLNDTENLSIVEGVLRLAQTIKRPVVAEGVESVELGMMLLQMGCQYAQGYGIARPMPAEQFTPWLSNWQDNSLWHKLPEEIEKNDEHFDLSVAIFSVRHWVDCLTRYIKNEPGAEKPILSEYECQFSHWYHGIGNAYYGKCPSYAFIPPKHSKIHAFGESLIKLSDKEQDSKAIARLGELDGLKEELIDLLRGLITQ